MKPSLLFKSTLRNGFLACSVAMVLWLAAFSALVAQQSPSQTRSLSGEPVSRISTHQDQPGHCLTFYWWNRLEWDTLWQESYTYFPQGLLSEMIHDNYGNAAFVRDLRQVMTYDTNGLLIERITQNWATGIWNNTIREVWKKDDNQNDTMRVEFAWRLLPGGYGWDTTAADRERFVYNGGNQISTRESFYWTSGFPNGFWSPLSRSEYFYNGLGEWDSLINSSWLTNMWVPSTRLVQVVWHDYALQQRSSYKTQYFQGIWQNAQRIGCSYQGLNSDCYSETYNNPAWDSTYRETRWFDAEEHLIQWERKDFNAGNWHVTNGVKHLYNYDGTGRTLELIDQNWDPSVGYLNAERKLFDAFSVGIAAEQTNLLEVTTYPNPVSDALHIRLANPQPVRISVMDMQGHLRLQCTTTRGDSETVLPLSESLPDGTYLYRIEGKTGVAQGKFILQR